jgi:ribosomal protein S18 acetylase RimI-like enzyme
MQRWLFPRDDRRIAQIAEVMHRDITYRIAPTARLLTGGDGTSAAFVEHRLKAPGPMKSLRVAPAFLSVVGPRAVRAWRMLRLVETAHRSVGPHLYVMHLAVAATARNRGRASLLLDHVMTEAKRLGVGVYLETANPAALSLYARHGLMVREEIRIPSVPPVWTLWRPPGHHPTD